MVRIHSILEYKDGSRFSAETFASSYALAEEYVEFVNSSDEFGYKIVLYSIEPKEGL